MTHHFYSRLSSYPVAPDDGGLACERARQRHDALEESLFELDRNIRQIRAQLGINPASWRYSVPLESEMPQFISVRQCHRGEARGDGDDEVLPSMLALTRVDKADGRRAAGWQGLLFAAASLLIDLVSAAADRLRPKTWLTAGLLVCFGLATAAGLAWLGQDYLARSAGAAAGAPGGQTVQAPAARPESTPPGKLVAAGANAGKAADLIIRVVSPGPVPQIAVLRIPATSRLNAAMSFVRLRGLPPEAALSQGVNQRPGDWILHKTQLRNLAVTLPPSWIGRLSIQAELLNSSGQVLSQSPLAADLAGPLPQGTASGGDGGPPH